MAIPIQYTFDYDVELDIVHGKGPPPLLGGVGSPNMGEWGGRRFGEEPAVEIREDGIWLSGPKPPHFSWGRRRRQPPHGTGIIPTGPALLKVAKPGDDLEIHYDIGCSLSLAIVRDGLVAMAIGDLSMISPSRLAGIVVQPPLPDDEEGYVTVQAGSTEAHRLLQGQSVRLMESYELRLHSCTRLLIPSRYLHLSFAACHLGVDPSDVVQVAETMHTHGRYRET